MLGGDKTCWVLRPQESGVGRGARSPCPALPQKSLGSFPCGGSPARGLAGHRAVLGARAGGTDLGTSPCLAACIFPEPSAPGAAAGLCLSLPTHPALPERVALVLSLFLDTQDQGGTVLLTEPRNRSPGTARRIGTMPRPRRLVRLIVCRRVYCFAPSSLFHPCLRRLPCPSPWGPAVRRAALARGRAAAFAPYVAPSPCDCFARWSRCSARLLSPNFGQAPAASPWSSRASG